MTTSETSGSQRARSADGRFLPVVRPPSLDGRLTVDEAKAVAGTEWATIRTWPLESGLIWLADRMKG